MKLVPGTLRWWSLALMLQLLYASSSYAQVTANPLTKELLKLEQALNVGVKNHDTLALKEIIAREYQLTGPRASQSVPRDKWLVNCFQWSFDSATHSDITVTNWEEVAVFRSLQHFYNLKVGNSEAVTKTPGSWITDLWIKRDGRWQLLTRLSEKLPKNKRE
jgi:hypothetical protein